MNFVRIQGARLELQRLQPADAVAGRAPIVFLHEGLGSVAMWRDWPAQVCAATGRAGIVYSRRGYGQSDPVPEVRAPAFEIDGRRGGRLLPDYLQREAFDLLPALLQALQIQAPVLLGHSDGASIALLYASRHPVTACVVMAPHLFVEDVSIEAIKQAREAYAGGELRHRLERYHADVDCAFWQWNDVWLSPAFRTFDIQPDCARITAPVLAIQGEEDPYGSMLQIERIATRAEVGLCKLAACGHSPQRDQPERTLREVRDFLAELA